MYDVVIYKKSDRRIDSIVGKDMEMEGRHNSVATRVATVLPRLNDKYDVTHVPAGKYREGDLIQEHLDEWTETRKELARESRD